MRVKIFCPTKTATQSGVKNTKQWLLVLVLDKNPYSIDDLTGWTTSKETLTQIKLRFSSKEAAIALAKNRRLKYEVIEPKSINIKPKSYAENFTK